MTSNLLLTLDTSTPTLTMGLYTLGKLDNKTEPPLQILAEASISSDSQRYHSAVLLPELTKLFETAGKTFEDLTDLAIHIGPGSFTGIRTGLISARTIGQFLPVSVYAINAFELVAFSVAKTHLNLNQGQILGIILDARRGRAYSAFGAYQDQQFTWVESLALRDLGSIIDLQTKLRLNNPSASVPLVGSERLASEVTLELILEELYKEIPASRQMAALLAELMNANNTEAMQPFQRTWDALLPMYLEEPNITLPKRNPAIIQISSD